MSLAPSPLSRFVNRVGICIALTELAACSPHAIPALHLGLPQMAQLVGDQVNDVLCMTELDAPEIASPVIGKVRALVSTERRNIDDHERSVALADPVLPQATADQVLLMVGSPRVVSAPTESPRRVLERDVKPADAGRTAKPDDVSQQIVIQGGEVLESHLRPPFRASLISARTYKVPASNRTSLRRRSSRMPITPRGYSVITRLGLTPWMTEASVFRLTTRDVSNETMPSIYEIMVAQLSIAPCETAIFPGRGRVEFLEPATEQIWKTLEGSESHLTGFQTNPEGAEI